MTIPSRKPSQTWCNSLITCCAGSPGGRARSPLTPAVQHISDSRSGSVLLWLGGQVGGLTLAGPQWPISLKPALPLPGRSRCRGTSPLGLVFGADMGLVLQRCHQPGDHAARAPEDHPERDPDPPGAGDPDARPRRAGVSRARTRRPRGGHSPKPHQIPETSRFRVRCRNHWAAAKQVVPYGKRAGLPDPMLGSRGFPGGRGSPLHCFVG